MLAPHPEEEAINFRGGRPLDLGIIHYASDTPYTRAQTLGARGISYFGMDSTYASTIAILRRVFQREYERMGDAGTAPNPAWPPLPAAAADFMTV